MKSELFTRFETAIRSLSDDLLASKTGDLVKKMLIERDGDVEVCYVPFEYVNTEAKVVIVGITPGMTQMVNALREARNQIVKGADTLTILKAAKQTGAFSGAMRPNLVSLLDSVGLNQWLDLKSCDQLFSSASALVQTTSALQNAVFIGGDNYSGTPNMIRHPLLRKQLVTYFGADAKRMKDAVFIPLGDKVAEALHFLADQGMLPRDRVLDGLPHPSGANAERIAYFLGRKNRNDLSAKTNPEKIDRARESMLRRVAALG